MDKHIDITKLTDLKLGETKFERVYETWQLGIFQNFRATMNRLPFMVIFLNGLQKRDVLNDLVRVFRTKKI